MFYAFSCYFVLNIILILFLKELESHTFFVWVFFFYLIYFFIIYIFFTFVFQKLKLKWHVLSHPIRRRGIVLQCMTWFSSAVPAFSIQLTTELRLIYELGHAFSRAQKEFDLFWEKKKLNHEQGINLALKRTYFLQNTF